MNDLEREIQLLCAQYSLREILETLAMVHDWECKDK